MLHQTSRIVRGSQRTGSALCIRFPIRCRLNQQFVRPQTCVRFWSPLRCYVWCWRSRRHSLSLHIVTRAQRSQANVLSVLPHIRQRPKRLSAWSTRHLFLYSSFEPNLLLPNSAS